MEKVILKAQREPKRYGYLLGNGCRDHSGTRYAFWYLYASSQEHQPYPYCLFHTTYHRCEITEAENSEERERLRDERRGISHHTKGNKVSTLDKILTFE